MKRILISFILLLLLMAGGSVVAVKVFINTDHIKQQVQDTLSGIGATTVSINGDVTFQLFPEPLLIFKDIQFSNVSGAASSTLLEIREAQGHVAWNSIFSRTPQFKDLTLISPTLELELLEDGRKNWQILKPVSGVLPTVGEGLIPSKITISDGRITYRVQNDKTDLSQINLTTTLESWQGPFVTNGKFTFRNEAIDFDSNIGNLSQATDANLNLSSPSFSTTLEGKTEGDNTLNISGILKMQIQNLGLFTGGVFPVYSLPTHITSSEEMAIEGAFTFSDKVFSLKQLSFNSESVKASAEVRATFGSTFLWDIQSHISLLNIDKLTSGTDENVSILTSPSALSFSMPKETSMLFYLTADKIVFRKDDILNTVVDAAMANQELVIHTLEGIVPGKSDFLFTGAISHNDIRPLLDGEIELNGTNFNALMVWLYPELNFVPKEYLRRFVFKSKLSMMPTRIRASDIRGNIDDIGVNGEFEIRPEERSPSYRFNFNLDRVNLNELRIPEKIKSSYEQLQKDVKDPFANTFISKLHGKYTFLISGKNMMLNGHKITNSSLDMTLSSEQIELRDLSINTEESDVTITYKSTLTGNTPTVDATLAARALNMDVFFPPASSPQPWRWSTQRFNYLGLEKFKGNFKAKIGFFKYDRLRLQNVEVDTSLRDGLISLRRAQGSIGGGPFVIKGQLGIGDANSFGLSFGVNGAEIADIVNIFSEDVNLRGRLFTSGKASSFGGTPATLINNMTGNFKLSAKDILVNNLGLSRLIQQAPLLKSAIDLDELKKEVLNSGSTLFNAASGNLELKSGIISTQDLKVATKYSRGLFAANFDMRSFLIKALSKHRFAINRSQTLSVDLNLSGSILNPEKELDVSSIEKFITDRAKRR